MQLIIVLEIQILEVVRKFRDTSGWYHLTVAINTDESAEDDRIKIFINGERLTVVATDDGSGSGCR